MAHRLIQEQLNDKPKKVKRFTVPNFNGKFGFSIYAGKKEVFLGVSIGEVEIEQIIRRRLVKIPKKAVVKVMQFD